MAFSYWSPEETDQLLELVKKKYKPHEICGMIPGRSYGSIIGRLNRLGIKNVKDQAPGKKVKIKLKPKDERPSIKGVKQPGLHLDTKFVPDHPRRLIDLKPGQCRQPVKRNGEGEWLMCAEPRCEESSYCLTHHQENYRPK